MSTFSTVRGLLDRIAADPNVSPAFRDAVGSSDRALRQEPVAALHDEEALAIFDAAAKLLAPIRNGTQADLVRAILGAAREASPLTLEPDEQEDPRQLTQADRDELQRDRDERNGDGPGKCVGRP